MGTKTFNNYEDLLTFTRASKGHALRPVSYGAELVTNGTFDSDTSGWSAYDGNVTLTQEGGELKSVSTSGATGAMMSSGFATEVGKLYFVSVESTSASTSHSIRIGTTQVGSEYLGSVAKTAPFTFTHAFIATTATAFVYLRNDVAGTIKWDNVSVKEVTFDQPDGTLTLFEHPNNVPRVEWDADRNRLGLLVEEARTNLFVESENFSDGDWSKSGITVAPTTAVTSPDQQKSAYLFTTNTASFAYAYDSLTVTAVKHTISAFVKEGNSSVCWLYVESGASYGYAYFDVSDQSTQAVAGSSTGPSNLKIQDVGNGWYRVSAVFDITTGGGAGKGIGVCDAKGSPTASAGKTMYVYGAQLEAGSFPTSYIKTTGATATRSADVASIPTADFGFNASEGSVVCEVQHFTTENSSAHAAFAFDDGTSSNRMWYYQNKGQWIGSVSGTTTFSLGVIYPDENALTKVGVTYKKDDYVIYINGDNEGSDTSSNVPVVDTFYIGNTFDSTTRLNGHIKSIQYYPRRLTNAQLQALTEPRSTPTLSLTFDGLESSYTENYIHG